MLVEQKFNKAIKSLQRAFDEYKIGDKRLALGSLDYSEDAIKAAKYLLIAEIKEDESNDEKVKASN